MEESTLRLKRPQYYRTDEKLVVRDALYKVVVAGLVKLSKLMS